MNKEDAKALVKTINNIFNGRKEIEDLSIDKYARALLYDLQKVRLLQIRREEFKDNGKFIRKYYWSFNNNGIKEAAIEKTKEEPFGIYKKIPKEAWLQHLNNN
ncbi:hypothetical protein AYK24_06815 [Thermoplasmatales archaeon SG8-52-4]|nr:MAG: hypothetical protein AYK24_06815 [Thermoplasmatales archaeon SG8-52-4]